MNLKSIITLIITIALTASFCFVVVKYLDTEMAKTIVATFLTIATSVVGFYIGYQSTKTNTTDVSETNNSEEE
jgi:putative Mn2+ efflux pump MntP